MDCVREIIRRRPRLQTNRQNPRTGNDHPLLQRPSMESNRRTPTDTQTDGWTDGLYQVLFLPRLINISSNCHATPWYGNHGWILYPCSPWYDASDEWLFACSGDTTQSEVFPINLSESTGKNQLARSKKSPVRTGDIFDQLSSQKSHPLEQWLVK